jgi:hypothetical protein
VCRKFNANKVQPIEKTLQQELNPCTRIQTFINTYRKKTSCVRAHKFVNNEHKICGYCYNSLDLNTAGNHVLFIIHFICVYAKPYDEHCDICGLNLVQVRCTNRCRRCVYKYRKFISGLSFAELTEFYNSVIPLAIQYQELRYKFPIQIRW